MSADPDVHAACIRQDPDGDYDDPLDNEIGQYVTAEWTWLMNPTAWSSDGCDEICDVARDLVAFILAKPTPHARYQAMVGVIGNLLERAAPEPTEEPTR